MRAREVNRSGDTEIPIPRISHGGGRVLIFFLRMLGNSLGDIWKALKMNAPTLPPKCPRKKAPPIGSRALARLHEYRERSTYACERKPRLCSRAHAFPR